MFKIFSSKENHAIGIFRLVESFLHSVRHYVLGFTLLLLFVTFYFWSAVPLNCLMNRIGIEEYFFYDLHYTFYTPVYELGDIWPSWQQYLDAQETYYLLLLYR